MRRTLWVACLLASGPALAAEPPAEPILRIDPGMHMAKIDHLAIDPQGRWLVTVSDDKTARVWDLASGKLQNVLRPPQGPSNEGKLAAVALSPDGATAAVGGWTQFNEGKLATVAEGNSVYVFDVVTGRMLRRIAGLPGVVSELAYSPDGHYLAAATASKNGVRVFKSDTAQLVGFDADAADQSYGIDFSRDGRLVTGNYDGYLRLFTVSNAGLRLLAKETLPGGKHPFRVRFSPDGRLIAVGFTDSPAVNVLDGVNLSLRYAPDTAGVKSGNFGAVAWSGDGQTLFASGLYAVNGVAPVRQYPQAGQGAPRDTPAANSTVMDLRAFPRGGVAFAAAGPAWGVVDTAGQRSRFVPGPIADFRNNWDGFQVARDGGTVRFSYEPLGKVPARFDLDQGLSLGADSLIPLASPRTAADGLAITDWRTTPVPKLNGALLALHPNELSRSLAIAPDGERFALGGEWSVRVFDRSGKQRWFIDAPAATWSVNVSGDGRNVVAAFGDGTIRWYDIEDGREKLAFFPHADRKRWVVWTPSGYYQASPGGEDLIGWHLNHGKDAAADFFPASRFRSHFNRPDVVARALSAPSEAEAVRLADAAAGRGPEERAASVQTLLPPVVEILSPRDGDSVSTTTVTVSYATRSPADAPVTGLRVRVDGQAVSLPAARGLAVAAASGERAVTIPIRAADSEIQLFAENKNGVSTPATLHLAWAGSAKAPAPADSLKPKLYVLVVGVAKYANAAFNLGLPSKDAHDFAAVLEKQKGLLYADVQVRLLTDAEATKDNVLDGLDWLQHQVTAHDVGMMFLAGHGINDNTGKYYFLPHNADPEKLLRTGVPQADIRDTLSSLAGKAVFFVDTCHSGNALGTAKTRGVGGDINGFVNDLASAENGVVVFTASTGRQFSLEDPAWGNGAFTKAVVEGLGGKADFQKNGRVSLKGLDYYVAERVKELTGGRQSPVSIAPGGVPDFPIAVVAK